MDLFSSESAAADSRFDEQEFGVIEERSCGVEKPCLYGLPNASQSSSSRHDVRSPLTTLQVGGFEVMIS